jgi:KRAB domain-containing zinc finger protein
VVGILCENKDILCGEVFSHTPDHIMSNNNPNGVELSESCVCKQVFIRHLSLSLPFMTHSGPKADEYHKAGEKSLQCKCSRKALNDSRLLNCHERSHTGEIPFVCKHCGKSFFHLSGLHKN